MREPHPTDIAGLVDVVRRAGSVHFLLDRVPGDFDSWRRVVRRQARAEQLRVSIRRVAEFVTIENLDYEVSADDMDALADVIGGRIECRDVGFDEALHARRRARLRLVTGSEPANADNSRPDGVPK
ncbi:MAG TPA: hypothetical protein VFT67_07600 [Jatrophihabitantaceae bacterium]|nr:hypothetical protein [Jatrophihabitantaceae bacterium]